MRGKELTMRSASAFRFSNGCSSLNLERMLTLGRGDIVVVEIIWSAGKMKTVNGVVVGCECRRGL